ncbi:MAG: GyrI-like domain-containing protein [Chloroflexi bacterium]|nr:GyrI-like domain-containing protein [Chloroflexota bacterium]
MSSPVVIALKRAGRRDLKVGKLEGLWWLKGEDYADFDPRTSDRSRWRWTAMLRWPDEVPDDIRDDAFARATRKVGAETARRLHVAVLHEGPCAQLMHHGPYADEAPSIERLHRFIDDQGLTPHGRHHEIYLTDARRSAPERMRTILRQPVR